MSHQKQTILSGIRASGKLHIGNYLGALKQFVDLQNGTGNLSAEASAKADCFFFIADLHAITTPFEPKELSQNTLEVAADYLAAGIDPKKSTFFLQNHVLEHAELGWIFNCLTSLGELNRMTQFKEKSDQHKESINAGLLTYPTLMAADILIYKPTAVPVGDDQTQHVELARTVARRFNNRFGQTFPEPQTYLRKPLRIMSLTDPTKKMSKTPHQNKFGAGQAGDDGALFLDDSPAEILRKLKKAPTATDATKESAGVKNLFLILEHFADKSTYEHFLKQQKHNSIKYSELKVRLSEIIAEHFAEFREKKKNLMNNPKKIQEALRLGAQKAQKTAQATLAEVKEKVGLL
ncbi:MAG: tryptophan--tRNA ligase [Candidatus Doudnabacteria bacterium]|nr:tryptophan--tRNA ligase [Candidatus Doudnabacteria bacterium]